MVSNVYFLVDPRTDEVRYVGETINPQQRLSNHLSEKIQTPKKLWIESLKAEGLTPELLIVYTGEDAGKVELRYINTLPNLLNVINYELPQSSDKANFLKKLGKKVKQYTLEGVYITSWQSRTAAAKSVGVPQAKMSKIMMYRNKLPRAGGYLWTDESTNIEDIFLNIYRKSISCCRVESKVWYFTQGQYVSTVVEAAKLLGVSRQWAYQLIEERKDLIEKRYKFNYCEWRI